MDRNVGNKKKREEFKKELKETKSPREDEEHT